MTTDGDDLNLARTTQLTKLEDRKVCRRLGKGDAPQALDLAHGRSVAREQRVTIHGQPATRYPSQHECGCEQPDRMMPAQPAGEWRDPRPSPASRVQVPHDPEPD